ncbi:MAG: lysophospholipid acyltransferase family protein [Bacillota bacterium]
MHESVSKIRDKIIPAAAYLLICLINSTLNIKVEGWDEAEKHLNNSGAVIFSAWHGKTWVPVYFLRSKGIYALASLSRDGGYMTGVLNRLGWNVIRGSSSRGGSRSLLSLFRRLKRGESAALTPDGPTGPIYEVKPGIIFLQERSDGVIIPIGVDSSYKKNFSSWDNYMLPLPFSKTALVFGDAVTFDKNLAVEEKQQILKEKMQKAERRASELI